MKTNKWILGIVMMASISWMACDDDDDNPIDKPELPDADETFVESAARSNLVEIEFGELAVTKASDSLVKAFAQQMVDEHTAAQNELRDIADDHRDIDWPDDLPDDQEATRTQLDNATGYSFDSLYMRTQITLHESAIQTFESGANNSTNARVKAYATKHLPNIRMHRDEADSIYSEITETNAMAGEETADGGTTGDGGTTDGGTTGDGGTTSDGGTAEGDTTGDGGTTGG